MAYHKSRVTDYGKGKGLEGFEYAHQHSSVPGDAPSADSLAVGEVAVNTADKVLYIKDSTGGVVAIGGAPSQVVSSGSLANLNSAQQDTIEAGSIVTTTDGKRWVYTGEGSKTSTASYIELADITPEWSAIANKPSTFTPSSHTHTIANITGLQAALDAAGGGGYTIHFANTNNDKLYMGEPVSNLSSVTPSPGDYVVVVNEAYRVEQYMGDLYGGTNWNYDINWRVIGRGTCRVSVIGMGVNGMFAGISTPYEATTDVGWFPLDEPFYVGFGNGGYQVASIDGNPYLYEFGGYTKPFPLYDLWANGNMILPGWIPSRSHVVLEEYA